MVDLYNFFKNADHWGKSAYDKSSNFQLTKEYGKELVDAVKTSSGKDKFDKMIDFTLKHGKKGIEFLIQLHKWVFNSKTVK